MQNGGRLGEHVYLLHLVLVYMYLNYRLFLSPNQYIRLVVIVLITIETWVLAPPKYKTPVVFPGVVFPLLSCALKTVYKIIN
jgi:hypothetical protein